MTHASLSDINDISISVITDYIAEQSVEDEENYVFSYTITIANNGEYAAKLLSRFWQITDANNKVALVNGEGVIGQQPEIAPKSSFTYTSGCLLKTPVGSMQGHYHMLINNRLQQIDIPVFGLAKPHLLN